jgi:hypothetical protein
VNECTASPGYCVNETSFNCSNDEGNYSCECNLGYEGKNCSTADCNSVSCDNGGTCREENVWWGTKWHCDCPPYYAGQFDWVIWLSEWVIGLNDWVSEWVSDLIKWLSEWVIWLNEWVSEWVCEWVSDWVCEWVSEWVNV